MPWPWLSVCCWACSPGCPPRRSVLVASRRGETDDNDKGYIDAPVTYADEVTPYTHLARRVMQLPHRPEQQIDELKTYLAYLESQGVRR